jgi:hypothetical protein
LRLALLLALAGMSGGASGRAGHGQLLKFLLNLNMFLLNFNIQG